MKIHTVYLYQFSRKSKKPMVIPLLHLLIIYLASFSSLASDESETRCQAECGNVTVPYPFGIGNGCRKDTSFSITCNTSFSPPKAFYGTSNLELISISLTQARVKNSVATRCYTESGVPIRETEPVINVPYPFTLSASSNMFTAIGCDNLASIEARGYVLYCASVCDKESTQNGSGIGWSQVPIPEVLPLSTFGITIDSLKNDSAVWKFNPCSYAFLAETEQFKFDVSDLSDSSFTSKAINVPVLLDWRIGNETCQQAQKNSKTYTCGENSHCLEVQGGGYNCNCTKGYTGNPYLNIGCQDIDECQDPNNKPCKGKCINTEGSYRCSTDQSVVIKLALGIGLGFLFLLISSTWLYFSIKKRKLIKLREKIFERNGGLLLQQQISSHEGGTESKKVFTAEELKKATNNFDERQILGQGGYGTVYKGILPDLRTVAIKKSKVVDKTQIEQFINEVVILTQINHRNVVKLFGCCLETQVPLLVYEFVSNGTLFEHIHIKPGMFSLTWDHRLRIATETAGALAYLHSAASIPIIHRDVKSANILLDENYTARVSDFGASRLVPLDQTQITTLVQGTLGYLDPEYLQSSQLTEKSDVYSFGVVLAELLTGEKPLSFLRSEEKRNLATYFISSIRENCLLQVIEDSVVNQGNKQQLIAVSELARRCLNLRGEDRPTMKEVVGELEGLAKFGRRKWVGQDRYEDEEEPLGLVYGEAELHTVPLNPYSGQYSQQHSMLLSLNLPR